MLKECKVVAEIGCVHLGKIDRARELIKLAKDAGADYIKLQKRNPQECVPDEILNKPHPQPDNAYGNTYLEHRNNLELNIGQHKELKEYCESIGIGYSSSVWDKTSAREIISLQPDYIKVPSACNLNFDLLRLLYSEFNGNIHISTGMIINEELLLLCDFLCVNNYLARTVIYHCTSVYPCPHEQIYLNRILRLREVLPDVELGFSDHGYGFKYGLIAYALGVTWIEEHFIDDRTIKHTDAANSLEPDGLRRLCRDLKQIRLAFTDKASISEEELKERAKLRKA